MIKDPVSKETPYEMLNLNPAASQEEVKKRIIEFQKERKGQMRDTQHARNILLDNRKRMELDLLLYDIGECDMGKFRSADIDTVVENLLKVPILQDDELYTDMDRDDLNTEIEEIATYHPSFTNECRFKDSDLERIDDMLIVFDF